MNKKTAAVVAGVLAGALTLTAAVTFGVWAAVRPDDPWEAMTRLENGCFNRTEGDGDGAFVPEGLEPIACTAPHDGEMLEHRGRKTEDFPEKYPSPQELTDQGAACVQQFHRQVLDPMTLPVNAEIRWYVPTERQWADGHRAIHCWFAFDGDLPTRSMRFVPASVTDDQQRFLLSVGELRASSAQAFDDRVSLRWRRAAAQNVASEYRSRTASMVRLGFETVRPQVAAMAAEDALMAEKWAPAGEAVSQADFEAALAATGGPEPTASEMALRRAIGLPVVQGELFGP